MTISKFMRHVNRHHLLEMVITIALILAALHVVFHADDLLSVNAHAEECQVCRVSNIPVPDFVSPLFITPLFVLVLRQVIRVSPLDRFNYKHILGARAPPVNLL